VLANLEARYGPDRPLLERMGIYIWNIVTQFDFAPSIKFTDRTVNDLIAQGFPVTLTCGFLSFVVALSVGGTPGALISVVVGTAWGAVAGYVGGCTDQVMMRIVDLMMSIPYMFVPILLLVVFDRSMIMLFVGIGLISWLDMARIVRVQTLSLKNREFVEAAIATGVRTHRSSRATSCPTCWAW